jgi:hypothetical protein
MYIYVRVCVCVYQVVLTGQGCILYNSRYILRPIIKRERGFGQVRFSVIIMLFKFAIAAPRIINVFVHAHTHSRYCGLGIINDYNNVFTLLYTCIVRERSYVLSVVLSHRR